MANLFLKLRTRAGELWWWSAIIFVSCRFGDAINAFIGLWLVPKYVPQEELGAALPLIQAGGLFGLPLALLVTPFSRWLTLYASRGEKGKVKRLLSIACYGAVVAFLVAVISARFVLPLFFERLRVAEGSLGFLIVCSGLLGPVWLVFNNALQGLKKFRSNAMINLFGAPVRLVVMLVAMPFRALSGYVVGQMAPTVFNIVAGWFALRRDLGRDVKGVPLGRDVRDMARFAMPYGVYLVIGTLLGTWQALLFRQRLPEMESAAYYMITRLAEIAAYAGISISFVVFPLAVEASQKKAGEGRLLARTLVGTLVPGLLVAIVLAFAGKTFLGVVPLWRDYVPYSTLLTAYTLRMALAATNGAFYAYETAAGRFGFLWYWLPCTIIETGVLVALTGHGAFYGVLPDPIVGWMASLDACRLSFFVWWLLLATAVQSLAILLHISTKRCYNVLFYLKGNTLLSERTSVRKPRVKVDGSAYYHVMSRCALQEYLFEGDGEEKKMFLKILRRAECFSGVKIVNYCIMDNHFHLLVHVPERQEVSDDELDRRIRVLYGGKRTDQILGRWAVLKEIGSDVVVERERAAMRKRMYDLSEFMKTFKQRFSLWFSTNHGNLEGSIWQGPFHSVLIEGRHDALGAVSAYITLNPIRAKMVEDPAAYAWSGYGAACNGDRAAKAALLSAYGGKQGAAEKWQAYKAMLEVKIAESGGAVIEEATPKAKGANGSEKDDHGMEHACVAKAMRQRDKGISRGVVLGSRGFVFSMIVKYRSSEISYMHPRVIAMGERRTPVFCAGRRRA